MVRSLLVVLGCLASMSAMAAESWTAEEVKLAFDAELNGVVFDADEHRALFPSLDRPREFKTWDEFFLFMKTEFFGEGVYDEKKQLVGVQIRAAMTNDAYRVTELGDLQRVGCDPVGEWIVGEFGYVVVAGEKIFVPYQPCWESAKEYLATRMRDGFVLAGAGGGCSTNGYCVANATTSGWFPTIYQQWGSSTFQARSQPRCQQTIVFHVPVTTCTSIGTSNNSLMSRVSLTNSVGGTIVTTKSRSGANTQRVDVEFVEWKVPWAAGGVVYNSAGACGFSTGFVSSNGSIEVAAASSVEAWNNFLSTVRMTCAPK